MKTTEHALLRKWNWLLCLLAILFMTGCPKTSRTPSTAPSKAMNAGPQLTIPRIQMVQLTDADRGRAFLHDYPTPLREGVTVDQLFKELQLQAWSFEVNSGPMRLWLECKEEGQQTMPPRYPAEGYWQFPIRSGWLLLSIGQGASERMQNILKQKGKAAYPDAVGVRIQFASYDGNGSGSFGTSFDNAPLWFGWPGGPKLTISGPTGSNASNGEAFTVLQVEATSTDQPAKKVQLVLKGIFGLENNQ